jgi:hypothetical protein
MNKNVLLNTAEVNVIKPFLSVIYEFFTKLEYLLDEVGKACQGQTLELVTKTRKLRTKSSITLATEWLWQETIFKFTLFLI